MLSSQLDERSLLALGGALMVLGAAGALLALDSSGQLYPQGVVGLVAGGLFWLTSAHRTGLLADLRHAVLATSVAGRSAPRTWHNRGVMTALPLVFDAPRRTLPPRHLADLDPADRRAAVGELGLPGFRADQLARHYFGRLTADVDAMTDLPAAAREHAARRCCRRSSRRCSSRPATTAPPARRSGRATTAPAPSRC